MEGKYRRSCPFRSLLEEKIGREKERDSGRCKRRFEGLPCRWIENERFCGFGLQVQAKISEVRSLIPLVVNVLRINLCVGRDRDNFEISKRAPWKREKRG